MISKCIDFNQAMSKLLQSFKKQNPNTREDVLQIVEKTFNVYKDHSAEEISKFF